ncbi:MAG TPA: hypothetical protein DD426_04200 [Clostridiaceae bacterium]|nr:hypothetical protein [Clostridiaceae bacterium]
MNDEIKKILKMVEEKKITAEEGEKLIDALDENTYKVPAEPLNTSQNGSKPKFLRIHVDGDDKVDVKIPLSLVEIGMKFGMKVGPKFSPQMKELEGIDFQEIIDAVKNGATGKIVDVHTSDETVEIYVE